MNFDYTSGLFEIGYFLIFGSQSITKTIGRKTYTEDGNRHKQKSVIVTTYEFQQKFCEVTSCKSFILR